MSEGESITYTAFPVFRSRPGLPAIPWASGPTRTS